jgi:tetratricopeptide (TPR) repeat protein
VPLFPAAPAPAAISADRAAQSLAWTLLAVLAARRGAHLEALSRASSALRHGDDDAALNTAAFSLCALGAFAAVAEVAERAVALNPCNDAAWAHRGVSHLHYGRYQAAVDDCRAALHLNPRNDEARRNMQTAMDLMRARREPPAITAERVAAAAAAAAAAADSSPAASSPASADQEQAAAPAPTPAEPAGAPPPRRVTARAAPPRPHPSAAGAPAPAQNFLLLGTAAARE